MDVSGSAPIRLHSGISAAPRLHCSLCRCNFRSLAAFLVKEDSLCESDRPGAPHGASRPAPAPRGHAVKAERRRKEAVQCRAVRSAAQRYAHRPALYTTASLVMSLSAGQEGGKEPPPPPSTAPSSSGQAPPVGIRARSVAGAASIPHRLAARVPGAPPQRLHRGAGHRLVREHGGGAGGGGPGHQSCRSAPAGCHGEGEALRDDVTTRAVTDSRGRHIGEGRGGTVGGAGRGLALRLRSAGGLRRSGVGEAFAAGVSPSPVATLALSPAAPPGAGARS